MSGGYALGSVAAAVDIGTVTASSVGTTVTSNASANTKGAYAQLIASTASDILGFWVMCGNSGVASQAAVDIAVGGAGSEQVIAANLQFTLSIREVSQLLVPIQIPAGTRISARMQSSSAADSCKVSLSVCDGGFTAQGYQICDTYGFSTANSLGTQLDPGGTINTKGAYAQLTASTTEDISAIAWLLDYENLAVLSSDLLMDIAIGAGGSEQIVIPNWVVKTSGSGSSNTITGSCVAPMQYKIPSGTRIAARCQSTDNAAATRKIGISFYGFS